MIPHVHTPSQKVETWGVNGMKSHLEHDHPEVQLPMRWGRADLHQAHLKAHQTPEETPVTDSIPEQKVEALAQRLYEQDSPDNRPTWDEVGQETRDHYRDRARTNLAAQADAENARKIVRARVNQPEPGSEGERRILVDRIICAMTGLDFDGEWVRDESLSLRRAMRYTYAATADRLVAWLEHGGALQLPSYASLAEDLERERSLVEGLEKINNQLRSRLGGPEAQVEDLRRLLIEAQNERDLLRTDKARLKEELEQCANGRQRNVGSIDALEARLAETQQERDRALAAGRILEAQRDEALERAADRDAVTVELLRLQEVAAGLEAERNGLAQKLAQVEGDTEHLNALTARVQTERTEIDRKRYETTQQLQRVSERLIQRTQALATGQAALGEFISELRRVKPDPSWHEIQHSKVIERLEAILEGSRLTSGVIVVEDGQPALGYATTGELIEEVRTRIDLGHCGLEYRTVDTEEI